MLPYHQDNIIAIATPPGNGALAIIRFSGKNLKTLFFTFTQKKPKNRYALYSKIYHPKSQKLLDKAIIIYYKAPNSFTGEDMIEISCHGGTTIKASLVKASIESGLRYAQPGEFSLRAFLNGKIDLMQAEAISSLIHSRGGFSSQASLEHVEGKASITIKLIRKDAINLLSVIENELNFSDNEIIPNSISSIIQSVKKIKLSVNNILKASLAARNLFSGIRIVIYGKPNVGKSTLFNTILGHDRAIISSEPGTTRDSIEAWFEIEGVPVCLVDTAGIWSSEKKLDSMSVNRTKQELSRADVCFAADVVNPNKIIDNTFTQLFNGHIIKIRTKSDLNKSSSNNTENYIDVSAKRNTGIDHLLTELSTYIKNNVEYNKSTNFLITERQRLLFKQSSKNLETVINQINSSVGMDIVASTLREFVITMGEIIGDISDKEIIDNIFNNFCIGK